MQIYAPYQYPDPEIFKPVQVSTDSSLYITTRFHTATEEDDFVLEFDPDIPGYLIDAPHGNLLIDLWADDAGDDWVASTVFKLTTQTVELAVSRAFGDWRNKGLVDLMADRANSITGGDKEFLSMETSTDRAV